MKKRGVKLAVATMTFAVLMGAVMCSNSSFKAKASEAQEVSQAESVEDMKAQLLEVGYTEEDLGFLYVCQEIEDINQEQVAEEQTKEQTEQVVEQMDTNMEEFYKEQQNELAGETCANIATELVSRAYHIWNSLTADEKQLVVTHPAKALAVNAASSRATEVTIMTFGINGLGDKSDGFRHAYWNALMSRDIGIKYAEKFATAHESGKTEEDLIKIAADGFAEKDHLQMDMHNNGVGRSVVSEDEKKEDLSDSVLARRVYQKMTNNIETGIYWLH